MSLSNLYFNNCFSKLTDKQKIAVDSISVENEVIDKSCARDTNTCGASVEELFNQYTLYDSQKGLYSSWGNIAFPWDIDVSVRSNLNYSLTDDKWKIAKYAVIYAYFEGDKVLYIESDGHKVSLYRANQDIVAEAAPIDKTKWDKICHIELSKPFGLPSLEELEKLYDYYDLDAFQKKWGDYSGKWEDTLFEQTVSTCNTEGISTEEFIEKLKKEESKYECVNDNGSDRWMEARIRKDNFYKKGDCILIKGVCEDTVCAFLAHTDMPANDEIYEKHKDFLNSPWEDYFQKLYCLRTNKNKCLERQRKRDLPNYQLIEVGSLNHYVEQPIPYYDLEGNYICEKDNTETLNERAKINEPKVLTQAEIDQL